MGFLDIVINTVIVVLVIFGGIALVSLSISFTIGNFYELKKMKAKEELEQLHGKRSEVLKRIEINKDDLNKAIEKLAFYRDEANRQEAEFKKYKKDIGIK